MQTELFQMAESVKTCPECGQPVPLERRRGASNMLALYCSDGCKTKACNRRQTEKQRLQTERNQVFYAADPLPQEGTVTVKLY